MKKCQRREGIVFLARLRVRVRISVSARDMYLVLDVFTLVQMFHIVYRRGEHGGFFDGGECLLL